MKTGTVLLVGAGLYGVWYMSQLGLATGTVSIVLDGVEIKGITNYVVNLKIQNVSNISVNVNSLTGDILLNGNELASISYFDKLTVPANGQINIPIKVSPSLLDLPSALRGLLQSGLINLNFSIIGLVNANGLVLPFNLDKAVSI